MRCIGGVRSTWWAASAFLVAGAVCAFGYAGSAEGSAWRAWLPNVATMFVGLAFTVTIVDWIVRRAGRARLDPLLGPVFDHIRFELEEFVVVVAFDYALTHTGSYSEVPADPAEVLRQWLDSAKEAELPPVPVPPRGKTLVEYGRDFVDAVAHHERDLGQDMEPAVRAALRSLATALQLSEVRRARAQWLIDNGAPQIILEVEGHPDRAAAKSYVARALELLDALRERERSPGLFKLEREMLQEIAEARTERLG